MQLADHRKQRTVLECAVHPRVPEGMTESKVRNAELKKPK